MLARSSILVFAVAAFLSSAAFAHHSFAPHFDASKPVTIVGTVSNFEARNPHAYLHVIALDANGQSHEYRCESHGVTQLERNGVRPELLAPGTKVTVRGSQARRDPYGCFFTSVTLADGRVLDVNGTTTLKAEEAKAEAALPKRHDIYGRWLIVPAGRSTSGPQPMMKYLTPAGKAAVAKYDPFKDDPTFRCNPVAVRRVWFAPGTPLEIEREGDRVILRYEWMDVKRIVYLGLDKHPADGPRTTLGHSIGHFEGNTLVIETANYSAGVLNQYVEQAGQPTKGLLHSDALTSVERVSFEPATQRLKVTIELKDPVFFTRPLAPVSAEYAPTDLTIKPFNCHPENPDHTLRG